MGKTLPLAAIVRRVGGLSAPSKMPGSGYGLDPALCNVGSRLRKIAGTVCSDCYACKGNYHRASVKRAWANRLAALTENLPQWIEDMVLILNRRRVGDWEYFRWHDSGDLQSLAHFEAICEIARRVPAVNFWLPTKEVALVSRNAHLIPENLTVRVSAFKAGATYRAGAFAHPLVTSSVDSHKGYRCPAYNQGGECRDCRACWSRSVDNVDYKAH